MPFTDHVGMIHPLSELYEAEYGSDWLDGETLENPPSPHCWPTPAATIVHYTDTGVDSPANVMCAGVF